MASRPVKVELVFNDKFSGRLALIAAAAHSIHVAWELGAATWEPHDWSTF